MRREHLHQVCPYCRFPRGAVGDGEWRCPECGLDVESGIKKVERQYFRRLVYAVLIGSFLGGSGCGAPWVWWAVTLGFPLGIHTASYIVLGYLGCLSWGLMFGLMHLECRLRTWGPILVGLGTAMIPVVVGVTELVLVMVIGPFAFIAMFVGPWVYFAFAAFVSIYINGGVPQYRRCWL